MEQVKVDETREEPPEWARPPEARNFRPSDPANDATDKQIAYIDSLIRERDTRSLSDEQRAFCESWLTEGPVRPSRKKASAIIETLLDLPKYQDGGKLEHMDQRLAVGVPAGRYAVENDEGELRFYKVWVSKAGNRLNVYVEHGPDESDLKYQNTVMSILNKIKAAGVRQCAIRYGMEIGACSNCGLRLTNRISRELGIGPVCGGRMFGDGFKVEVKAKRAEIKARGEDPNEMLDD